MSLEADLLALMLQAVTLYPRLNVDGDRIASYGSGVTVAARIEFSPKKIVDASGREVISSARVFIPPDTTAHVTDQITMPEGDNVNPTILRVDRNPDETGLIHHQVIYV